jgi:hypothetical protein
MMKWLKRTVHLLYALSTSTVLSEGISLVRLYILSHASASVRRERPLGSETSTSGCT